MRFIPLDLKVLRLPAIDAPSRIPAYEQLRKLPRLSFQLHVQRLHMIQIDMRIAHRVYERAGYEIAHMRQHVRQQSVRSDVEGYTEAHVARPLIELTRKSTFRFRRRGCRRPSRVSVLCRLLGGWRRAWERNVKLGKHMARRQGHLPEIRRVPRAQDDSAVVRLVLQFFDHLSQLVNALARVVRLRIHILGSEVAPLKAVDGAEVSLRPISEADGVEVSTGAVAVPYFDAGGGEGDGGGGARDKPEEFGDDGAEEDAFGGQKGEDADWGGGRVGGVGGAREGEAERGGGEEGEGAGAGSVCGTTSVPSGQKVDAGNGAPVWAMFAFR